MRCALLLLLFPAAFALAEDPASAAPAPIEVSGCAASVSEMAPRNLQEIGNHKKKRKRWLVEINDESPCLAVSDTSATYAQLLELPDFEQPYRIDISSMMRKKKKSKTDQLVFVPTIVLLDGDMQPTRTFDDDDFRYRGNRLNHSIFMNDENAAERMMLVYSSPEDIGKTDERVAGGVNTGAIYTGYGFAS